MEPLAPLPNQARTEALRLHGFTEGSERPLWDLPRLAATFCGAAAVLALRDETGLWFCEGSGLSPQDLVRLAPILAQPFVSRSQALAFADPGLRLVASHWLVDSLGRARGCLALLAPAPVPELDPAQREGLRLVAEQLGVLVAAQQETAERRILARGPAATSFVPGLVHELRNFSFGISASLDAFEARFADAPATGKYGRVMRTSLERLNAFVEELQEYGDPRERPGSERNLEPILHEAIEHHHPLAERCQVALRLQVNAPLPRIRGDEASLRTAFIRLLDLALQQEPPGGELVLEVDTRRQGEKAVLFGHLDGRGLNLQGVDLGRLFEPFYFRASGLGRLALPVVRRIFEAHGGSLSAEPGPHGGMRMGFMLPAL